MEMAERGQGAEVEMAELGKGRDVAGPGSSPVQMEMFERVRDVEPGTGWTGQS